jgi:pyruvate/2-oxoglutarate dehydrogenase complex dihydrolipoamide dehydrogenase (E3) component
LLPWSTFTDPEIATIGTTEAELKAKKTEYDVYKRPYKELDRALCDGATKGFVKILTRKGSSKILGATVVGGPAGDMICQITMAMYNKLDVSQVGAAVSPYPCYSDGIKNLTDQFNRTKLTPFTKSFLRGILCCKR